jgi:hypothetical protein
VVMGGVNRGGEPPFIGPEEGLRLRGKVVACRSYGGSVNSDFKCLKACVHGG